MPIDEFRTLVAGEDYSRQPLAGSFIGRSEVRNVSFRGADLSGSTLCWNDFTDVDFTDASLRNTDLRCSTFERCAFTDADLTGALVSSGHGLDLSLEQRAAIVVRDDEPAGG